MLVFVGKLYQIHRQTQNSILYPVYRYPDAVYVLRVTCTYIHVVYLYTCTHVHTYTQYEYIQNYMLYMISTPVI